MIFDATHTLYIIISLLITIIVLFLAKRKIKKEKGRDVFLRFFAIGTFLLHISAMWTTYLTSDSNAGIAFDNILFPIYFCNLAMYCLMICSFLKKGTTFYHIFATFTAWAGIFGSLISLFYPDYYLHHPTLRDWLVLKSMLSHSTMLIGALYLFIGNFVAIRKANVVYYFYGLLGCLVIGLFTNGFLSLFGKDVNAMYLKHPPLEEVPMLNFLTISLLMLFIIYIASLVYTNKDYQKKKQSLQYQ